MKKFICFLALAFGGLFHTALADPVSVPPLSASQETASGSPAEPLENSPIDADLSAPSMQNLGAITPEEAPPVSLEDQVRHLLGILEEQQHELSALRQRIETLEENSGPEKHVPSANLSPSGPHSKTDTSKKPPAKTPHPPKDEIARLHAQATAQETLPLGSAQEEYNKAMTLIKGQKYDEAIDQLNHLLTAYPNHPLRANTSYWIADAYFAKGDFEKAASLFAQAYQDFSKSDRGPDMLLKVALCLEKQKKKEEACIILGQLKKDHPNLAQGTRQGIESAKKRLRCEN